MEKTAALEFTKEEELEATLQIYEDWQNFHVPRIIEDRIMILFFEKRNDYDLIVTLMKEFEAKKCYMEKCFFFSEANRYNREQVFADGGFYNCRECSDNCVPFSIKDSL